MPSLISFDAVIASLERARTGSERCVVVSLVERILDNEVEKVDGSWRFDLGPRLVMLGFSFSLSLVEVRDPESEFESLMESESSCSSW